MLGFTALSEVPLGSTLIVGDTLSGEVSLAVISTLAANGVLVIIESSDIVPITAYINQEEPVVGCIYKVSGTNQYVLKTLEQNLNIDQLIEQDLQLDQQLSITLER
jgi:hypothetical protein